MLSSIFRRRVALRAPTSVVARSPAIYAISTRSLFATPPFNTPPVKVSESTEKETTRKTRTTPAKRGPGRPQKSASKHQEKQPKQEKQRVRVPEKLRPPKRAPGPYFVFYASFLKSQPKGTTLQDFQELSKRAGQVWRGYTMAEKQPFYDESEARKATAKQARDEFFSNTSLSDLKQLNAIRKAQGKSKFHYARRTPLPVTPFILFSNEFRNTPDGQALIEKTSPEKRYPIRAVVAAGDRWRSMSPEEKAPYFESFRKAKEELQAEQSDSQFLAS